MSTKQSGNTSGNTSGIEDILRSGANSASDNDEDFDIELTQKVGQPDILKADGGEFLSKAPLINVLKNRDLLDTYGAYETENGGWIGVPIGDQRLVDQDNRIGKAEIVSASRAKKTILCRVHRANCDNENRDLVIKVTANSPKERKVFLPGEEVGLTATQIEILKNSVLSTEIVIDRNSGIYSARDPLVAAKNQYPGMQIRRDPKTGYITAFKNIPNYIIERLE